MQQIKLQKNINSFVLPVRKEDCFYGLGDKSGFLNKRGMSMKTGIQIIHRHTMKILRHCINQFHL